MDLKGREKTLKHSASCLKKGRGWRHFFYHRQWQKRNECNILHKVHWGRSPVLWIHSSASGQPSYTVHYCVRLKEEEKKRGGSSGGKENLPLCRQRERELVFICVCQRKQDFFFPHTNSWEHLLLFYATVAAYEWASRAGKQRHPGFSWWWELTSDWFPWILMWRIVCFIEEQKEARWLPFRIC